TLKSGWSRFSFCWHVPVAFLSATCPSICATVRPQTASELDKHRCESTLYRTAFAALCRPCLASLAAADEEFGDKGGSHNCRQCNTHIYGKFPHQRPALFAHCDLTVVRVLANVLYFKA